MATYRIVVDTIAMASARGIVRLGCTTSPLAHRDVSIPTSENTARISARPVIPSGEDPWTSGCVVSTKFELCIAVAPARIKIANGASLFVVVLLLCLVLFAFFLLLF